MVRQMLQMLHFFYYYHYKNIQPSAQYFLGNIEVELANF